MAENNQHDFLMLDTIKQLVELMKANNLAEVDIERGDSHIHLRGQAPVQNLSVLPSQVVLPPVPAPAPVSQVPAAPASVPTVQTEAEDESFFKTINSPMVGTFYVSSNPDAPPFAKVGDIVQPEQTVCIIEAMKVFNEIQAEMSGKIVAVLVKDGMAVEYGTPLFKIDTRD